VSNVRLQEIREFLLEEALELWASVLLVSPSPASQDVLALAEYIFPVLDDGTINLRKGIEITESYILLAPRQMLDNEMRQRLFAGLAELLGKVKREANGLITHVVEIMIQEAHALAGEQAIQVIADSLMQTGFVAKVCVDLRESWDARQTTGPNKVYPSIDGVVETDYLSVFARLSVCSPLVLTKVIESVGTQRGETFETCAGWILGEWFAHFEAVADPTSQKLHCLGLTRLLELVGRGDSSWVLGKLQDYMVIWTDVVAELQDVGGLGSDYLVLRPREEWETTTPDSAESVRRRELEEVDPVRKVNLPQFVRSTMETVSQTIGEQAFQQEWLDRVDKDIVAGFQRMITEGPRTIQDG
jgi:hypothetical protein